MVKFLKVRVLQRTPPDPPRGRASRDERPTPAMRRPAARSPRCLPSPRAPASDAGAPRRGDRGRAGPSAPPDGRVAMPPSARVADSGGDVAATDARARSTRTRAEPRWRWRCFFPVASARKRRPRDDRDAIDAERRARRRTRRASSARPRSVVHRRLAGAAGRRAGLRFSFRVCVRWRSQLRALGGGRETPSFCRQSASSRAPLTRAMSLRRRAIESERRPPLVSSFRRFVVSRPTKSSWSCRAATPARRL